MDTINSVASTVVAFFDGLRQKAADAGVKTDEGTLTFDDGSAVTVKYDVKTGNWTSAFKRKSSPGSPLDHLPGAENLYSLLDSIGPTTGLPPARFLFFEKVY